MAKVINSNHKWKAIKESSKRGSAIEPVNEELYGERSITIDSGTAFLKTVSGTLPDSGLSLPIPLLSLYGQEKEVVQDPSVPLPVQSIYETALGNPDNYWKYGFINKLYATDIKVTSLYSRYFYYQVSANGTATAGKLVIQTTKTTAVSNNSSWDESLLKRFISGYVKPTDRVVTLPDNTATRSGTLTRPTYTFTFVLETDELSASEITNPTFYLNGSVTSNSFTKTLNGSTLTYTRTEPASGSFTYTSQGGSYKNGYASPARPFMFEPYLYPYVVNQSQTATFTSWVTSVIVDLDNSIGLESVSISNIQYDSSLTSVTYNSSTQQFTCTRSGTGSTSVNFTYTMTGGLSPKFYIFENGTWTQTTSALTINLLLTHN